MFFDFLMPINSSILKGMSRVHGFESHGVQRPVSLICEMREALFRNAGFPGFLFAEQGNENIREWLTE